MIIYDKAKHGLILIQKYAFLVINTFSLEKSLKIWSGEEKSVYQKFRGRLGLKNEWSKDTSPISPSLSVRGQDFHMCEGSRFSYGCWVQKQ